MHQQANAAPSVHTPYETAELLEHWATALHKFQIAT